MHLCITQSVTRWVGADTVNRHMNKNSPLYCIFSSYILVNKLAPYCPQIVVFYDWSTSVNIGHSKSLRDFMLHQPDNSTDIDFDARVELKFT